MCVSLQRETRNRQACETDITRVFIRFKAELYTQNFQFHLPTWELDFLFIHGSAFFCFHTQRLYVQRG